MGTDSAVSDPLSVAQAYVSAFAARDWRALAGLLDPEWLADFREDRIEHARTIEAPEQGGDQAVGYPGLPPEVAAWFRAQRSAFSRSHECSVASEFAGVRSSGELASLDSVDVLVSAFESFFPKGYRMPEHQWLGVVLEKDSAHVVYRASRPEIPEHSSVDLISLRWTTDGWRVLCDRGGPFQLPGFGAGVTMVGHVTAPVES